MSTLTITLSERTLARLRERAADLNTTPEALLAADVEAQADAAGPDPGNGVAHPAANGVVPEWPANPDDDPLLKLLGSIKSDVTDVSERHDDYIGQALYDELRGGDDVR